MYRERERMILYSKRMKEGKKKGEEYIYIKVNRYKNEIKNIYCNDKACECWTKVKEDFQFYRGK